MKKRDAGFTKVVALLSGSILLLTCWQCLAESNSDGSLTSSHDKLNVIAKVSHTPETDMMTVQSLPKGESAGALASDDVRLAIPIPGPPLVPVNLCLGGTVTDENGHKGQEAADPFGLARVVDGNLGTFVTKDSDSPGWLEVTFRARPRWINKVKIAQTGAGSYQVECKDLWGSWHALGTRAKAHSPGAVVGYDTFDFEPVKAKAIRWRSSESASIESEGHEIGEIEAYFHQKDDDDFHYEVGVEWVNDYPGEDLDLLGRDDDALDLYNTVGEQPGWWGIFEWGNASAFEEDFKRFGLGGDEDDEIDQVDLAYFCGHGTLCDCIWDPTWGAFRRALVFGVEHDDYYLVPGEGGRWSDGTHSWGDADLEWLGFSACETMIDHRYWANCLNGLHLILGWATISNDIFPYRHFDPPTLGWVWAREMLAGRTITQAWFNAAEETHPGGRIAAVVAEEMADFNDHLWGVGPVSADPLVDGWYHYWTFTVPWMLSATKEKEERRGEYLSERLNDSSDPLVPFPSTTGKRVPIKYKSSVLSSVQETTMVQYYVIPRSVDSAYVQSIADRMCTIEGVMCCTAQIESDGTGHLWMICGSEELKVSEASGGVQYLNSGWWMVPPTVGPILPEPTQVFTLANGFLTEMMMKPPDSYVWLVSLAHLGWFMKETGKADDDSSMYTSIVAAYRRETTGGYQVTGPGAVLNVTYGDNNRLERWAMGGWRDVTSGPEVSVITAEEAMGLVATEGSGATIGGIPLFDTLIVLEAELAYWEESADVLQNQLEIVWALTCLCVTQYDTTEVEIYVPARALPPKGSIDAPPDSTWYDEGEAIVFAGSATGGITPYTFDWYSDVDGYLAGGEIVTINTLSAIVRDGAVIPHTITFRVTDLNDMGDNVSISVFVFKRGDANGDGLIDLGDAVYVLNYLFKGGPAPDPLDVGDANCDGVVEIGDAIYLLNYLFKGGLPPGCP